MIEVAKNYKITLTEEQGRQLHQLLQETKFIHEASYVERYSDLRELRDELKQLFDSGIR